MATDDTDKIFVSQLVRSSLITLCLHVLLLSPVQEHKGLGSHIMHVETEDKYSVKSLMTTTVTCSQEQSSDPPHCQGTTYKIINQ